MFPMAHYSKCESFHPILKILTSSLPSQWHSKIYRSRNVGTSTETSRQDYLHRILLVLHSHNKCFNLPSAIMTPHLSLCSCGSALPPPSLLHQKVPVDFRYPVESPSFEQILREVSIPPDFGFTQ